MVDVRTVNLFQKGIWEIEYIEDGHRVFKMMHQPSNTLGFGPTRQAAYDDLMEKMDG